MAKKPAFKSKTTEATKQATADKKLAETPSPARERVEELGDWAASNNPSPEEQVAEAARADAIRRQSEV